MNRKAMNPNVAKLAEALQKSRDGEALGEETDSDVLKALRLLQGALGGSSTENKPDHRRTSPLREWLRTAKPGDVAFFPITSTTAVIAGRELGIKVRTATAVAIYGAFTNPLMEVLARVEVLNDDGTPVQTPGRGSDSDDDGSTSSVPPEGNGDAPGS